MLKSRKVVSSELARKMGIKLMSLRGDKPRRVIEEEAGLPPDSLCRIEYGWNPPKAERLVALCRYYNVSADYLLGLEDAK